MKENKWEPLFIVGSGRSGSTFLSALLNGSNEIYFPYETSFVARAYRFYKNKPKFTQNDYITIANLFKIATTKGGWGMTSSEIYDVLVESRPANFKEVNNVIYNFYLVKKKVFSIKYLGLRKPQMIAHKDRIRKIYPEAKFIHIIRDGRDVYLSYKELHEKDEFPFGPKSIFLNALYWVDIVRRYKEDRNAKVLKYESLLKDTEKELIILEKFLGLFNLKSAIIDYSNKKEKSVVTSHQLTGINKKVYHGVDKNNTKKYIYKMSKIQLFFYEMIAGYYLRKFRYTLIFGNIYVLFLPVVFPLFLLFKLLNNIRYVIREYSLFIQAKKISL